MGDNAMPAVGQSTLLPVGWTSHISPTGRTYYHNASSGVSTYTFPQPKPPRREKPASKTLIPNTSGWLKVTTNKDNVFYFHPETKTSQWLPPPHVVDALKQIEEDEAREKEQKRKEEEYKLREERDRLRRERMERKRKLEEGVPITEFDASKRARGDEEGEEDGHESEPSEDEEPETFRKNGVATAAEAPKLSKGLPADTIEASNPDDDDDDEDDEDWQRQIAEQMAAEADADADTIESKHSPPLKPIISIEEAKHAFMDLLTSLNGTRHEINPMAPWDLEQPKFSSHPSFLALPSSREREDAFNEWCKLRIREKRAAKTAAATNTSSSSSQTFVTDPVSPTAKSALLALLRAEVRSTRTKFSDFRGAFSRDPRFTAYGRSDVDREKLFKKHLVQLGEEKRAAAQRAETDFLALLSDRLPGNYRGKVAAATGKEGVMDVWMQAKRTAGLVEDKRYDAVGSSTRRYELFEEWAKGERRPTTDSSTVVKTDDVAAARARQKEEARMKALREREEKVRLERQRIQRINRTAFSAATREESLLSFRQLLLDAVHTPHTSYTSAVAQLSLDPRFAAAALSEADKQQLFAEHQTRLSEKEDSRIGSVFARYAPSLDTHRDDVLARTLQDAQLSRPPLSGFAEDRERLEEAYDRWAAQKRAEAEQAFKEMLCESAFVEFWGRLKKQATTSTSTTESKKERRDDGEEEDDEEEAEGATLVDMAKRVDLAEIESVLRNDARFRAWKHDPEQRRRWIRQHLQQLAAPANSVHR
ncbi:hypothetical protein EX895_006403 [Sporisorium graminicola]|uniref:WW domain-containing protein n=1 Tax=Sporisorium graminicola TaxID=280036 RepID=A0A4U7KNN0_9BASI|nr:hypothetical protein EX895_006403 [Sporisorium graminicola]TKY84502.1 hypothetical protein EX895_006403 [Sporisorium graminicola]